MPFYRFPGREERLLPSVLQRFVLLAHLLLLRLGGLAPGRGRDGGGLRRTRSGLLLGRLGLHHGRDVHGGRSRLLGRRSSRRRAPLLLFLLFPAVAAAAAPGSRLGSVFVVAVVIVGGGRSLGRVDAHFVQDVVEVVQVVAFGFFLRGLLLGLLFRLDGLPGFLEAALSLGLFFLGFLLLVLAFFFLLLLRFVFGVLVFTLLQGLFREVDVEMGRRDRLGDLIRSDRVGGVIFVIALVQIIVVIVRGIRPATHDCRYSAAVFNCSSERLGSLL
mmetsp:Transcript_7467/g.18353  ORF Transcript_7467/g.18353 Transcript_7467/m.18353 type:complete len:273 (+) Transcript_7467:164-982(+)